MLITASRILSFDLKWSWKLPRKRAIIAKDQTVVKASQHIKWHTLINIPNENLTLRMADDPG
jgi:hypothetical protein